MHTCVRPRARANVNKTQICYMVVTLEDRTSRLASLRRPGCEEVSSGRCSVLASISGIAEQFN